HRKHPPPTKYKNEGEQIDRKRNDPQQRYARNVRRQITGDAQHQTRRHKREQEPAQSLSSGNDFTAVRRSRAGVLPRLSRRVVSAASVTLAESPHRRSTE